MNDRDLMAVRADILFTYDARGRMLRSNEGDARPAPHVFLGCTAAGTVVRFGPAVPDAVARSLAATVKATIEGQPPNATLRVPPAAAAAVREALAPLVRVTADGGGLAYRFPEAVARPVVLDGPVEVVQLTATTIGVVRDTYPWLLDGLPYWAVGPGAPCFAVVRDGAAVSICFTSRSGSRAAEAGVETLPAFRGRGYAAAATAAWGAHVAAAGRIPLYSTGWDNAASQAVARRAGLIMYGADAFWT